MDTGRVEPRALQPLPARVLRRPAPADRRRARAGARPEAADRRRAGLRARRVDPGAGAEPAARAPARDGPDARADLARPVGRAAHVRPGGGDERRARSSSWPRTRRCTANRRTRIRGNCSRPCPARAGGQIPRRDAGASRASRIALRSAYDPRMRSSTGVRSRGEHPRPGGRGHGASAETDPLRHGEPAGERARGAGVPERLSDRGRLRVRAARRRARAAEPRGATARGREPRRSGRLQLRRSPAPRTTARRCATSATSTRCSRTPRSGSRARPLVGRSGRGLHLGARRARHEVADRRRDRRCGGPRALGLAPGEGRAA